MNNSYFQPIDFDAIEYLRQQHKTQLKRREQECLNDIVSAIKAANASNYGFLWILYDFTQDEIHNAKAQINWALVNLQVEFFPASDAIRVKTDATRMLQPVLIAEIG